MITLQVLKHIDALVCAESNDGAYNADKVYEADEINTCLASLRRLKPALYKKLLGAKLSIIGSNIYNGADVDTTPGLRVSFACARAQLAAIERKVIALRDAIRDSKIQLTVTHISASFVPECDCVVLQDEFIFFDTKLLSNNCRLLIADDNIVELDDETVINWLRFACEQVNEHISVAGAKDVEQHASSDTSDDDEPEAAETKQPARPIHVIYAHQNQQPRGGTDEQRIDGDEDDPIAHEQMQETTTPDTKQVREAVVVENVPLAGRHIPTKRKNKFYL